MTRLSERNICTQCILPNNFPGIIFDELGVCQYCKEKGDAESNTLAINKLRKAMEKVIDKSRESVGEYQCIVALSGGKDSTFTLKMLVNEYNMNCLAVTVDNGFLSTHALENINRTTDALGVDHIYFKPKSTFMRTLYNESIKGDLHVQAAIKRASKVCTSCINLINTHMMKTAIQYNTPMIAGGYIGGQVPKDKAVLDIDLSVLRRSRSFTLERYQKQFGNECSRFFDLPPPISNGIKTPQRLVVINPMLTISYSEKKFSKTSKL